MARKLREAGLARVNLSLDSLRPEVYAAITRGGTLRTALEGLVAALEAGLSPVKVNAVMLGGVNDADLVDLALLAWAYPVVVRFIELMPLGDPEARSAGNFVSGQALLARLARQGGLSPVAKVLGSGPAMYHEWMPRRPPRRLPRLPGLGPSRTGPAVIGVISPITRPFCSTCNRLRLTARGMLHACLAADGGVDLRRAIRMGAGSAELASLIAQAVAQKPPSHGMASGHPSRTGRKMSELGG
jgi:cyclic pyranopterin phosphate synthase